MVICLMALLLASMLLKMTFCSRRAVAAVVVCTALVTGFSWPLAITRSRMQIADWLSNPDLMADTAVLLFVEVALQIAFCIRHAFPERQEGSRISRWLYLGLKGFPGLLYLVVIFSLQVQLIFMLPGVSFPLVSWSLAAAVSVFIVLGIWAMRRLVPEEELRLELLFLVNAVIAALGVIATVNGRSAANFLTT